MQKIPLPYIYYTVTRATIARERLGKNIPEVSSQQ
jgi:hypothetical protein